jgi:hypothetical protein
MSKNDEDIGLIIMAELFCVGENLFHPLKRRRCHEIKEGVMGMGRGRGIDDFIDGFVLKRFRENDFGTLCARDDNRSCLDRNLRHVSSTRNPTIGP